MAFAEPVARALVNHVGYDVRGSKKFIVQAPGTRGFDSFRVVGTVGSSALKRPLEGPFAPDRWTLGVFYTGRFSDLTETGDYRIAASGPAGQIVSPVFRVGPRLLAEASIPDALCYFKAQRSSGAFDRADRQVRFFGETRGPVDVHGGWFDASGDTSKYLSHLNYTNFMVPQQTPLVVWALLDTAARLRSSTSPRLRGLEWRLHDEALHGADFLVRMLDPAGYFYVTVFDRWTKNVAEREICAYATQQGHKSSDYQAGLREGGGMAIAALARTAGLGQAGEFPPAVYLESAGKGFAHLEAHNPRYLDDGRENIIDDYCTLLAGAELYGATGNDRYLTAARQRSTALVRRLHRDAAFAGFWRADEDERPFFHASDAGLPVVALLRYAEIEPDERLQQTALDAVLTSLRFELAITREVANPFGYARQYVSDPDGTRSAFFFPHRNESGYWWQGESARLGSLAAAAFLGSVHAPPDLRHDLERYATDQLDWVLGLNPFDACMQMGRGRNTPDYEPGWPNVPGGVSNGITAGVHDEHDIALLPPPEGEDPAHRWRWAEQWLPHAAWLILALSAQQISLGE